jgi:acetyl-CoA carboxylase carboxyl transferase subunit beta
MAWFKKEKTRKQPSERKLPIREGLWLKCDHCGEIIYKREVLNNANVCPKCNYHFRITARERLEQLLDDGRYVEFDAEIAPGDPLEFNDTKPYTKRLEQYQSRTGLKDAVISCTGKLGGYPVVAAVMEYGFMGGSMGSVVGEKVTRAAERALEERAPLFVISCSGGARMQEGALSLMQMAKISAALARLDEAGLPFQKLPAGFQRSEFLVEHGMLDFVVERSRMRDTLITCLEFMVGTKQPSERSVSAISSSESPG